MGGGEDVDGSILPLDVSVELHYQSNLLMQLFFHYNFLHCRKILKTANNMSQIHVITQQRRNMK